MYSVFWAWTLECTNCTWGKEMKLHLIIKTSCVFDLSDLSDFWTFWEIVLWRLKTKKSFENKSYEIKQIFLGFLKLYVTENKQHIIILPIFLRRVHRTAVQRQQGGLRLPAWVRRRRLALRTRHHLPRQELHQPARHQNGNQELHVLRVHSPGSGAWVCTV